MLLPAVRAAAKDTLIVADGFSCREQIEQLTDSQALHFAQVVQMAMKEGPRGPAGNFPEKQQQSASKPATMRPRELVIAAGLIGAILFAASYILKNKNR